MTPRDALARLAAQAAAGTQHARLVYGWEILDLDATQPQLEAVASACWPAVVAEHGLYGSTPPRFRVQPGEQPWLWGEADALAGPVELRSHRQDRGAA